MALAALQEALEAYLVALFEDCNLYVDERPFVEGVELDTEGALFVRQVRHSCASYIRAAQGHAVGPPSSWRTRLRGRPLVLEDSPRLLQRSTRRTIVHSLCDYLFITSSPSCEGRSFVCRIHGAQYRLCSRDFEEWPSLCYFKGIDPGRDRMYTQRKVPQEASRFVSMDRGV